MMTNKKTLSVSTKIKKKITYIYQSLLSNEIKQNLDTSNDNIDKLINNSTRIQQFLLEKKQNKSMNISYLELTFVIVFLAFRDTIDIPLLVDCLINEYRNFNYRTKFLHAMLGLCNEFVL